jgi:hypothetical protein
MKLRILLIIASFIALSSVFSQAKKPTIMVVPSDEWCLSRGYFLEFENQGRTEKLPDYKRAFQENSDLLLVISTINGIMAERGFPLKNLESALKTVANQNAEDNIRTSSKTGAAVNKSPIDELKAVAKADIIMQLTWTINSTGPKKSITFNLQGIDAYSDKQIATAVGTGAPSFSTELPVLLSEAVNSHMDAFTNSLQTHFDDLFENGREIIVRVRVWDDWDEDLLSEFGNDDMELSEIIENWIEDNTVKGRNNLTDGTENIMLFEQVRIPLYYTSGDKERAMDAKTFGTQLRKYLDSTLNIESLVENDGLGKVTLFLGHK